MREVLQSLQHLICPLLDSVQYVCVSLVLGSPELDGSPEMDTEGATAELVSPDSAWTMPLPHMKSLLTGFARFVPSSYLDVSRCQCVDEFPIYYHPFV